jgi:hypothetical protein
VERVPLLGRAPAWATSDNRDSGPPSRSGLLVGEEGAEKSRMEPELKSAVDERLYLDVTGWIAKLH